MGLKKALLNESYGNCLSTDTYEFCFRDALQGCGIDLKQHEYLFVYEPISPPQEIRCDVLINSASNLYVLSFNIFSIDSYNLEIYPKRSISNIKIRTNFGILADVGQLTAILSFADNQSMSIDLQEYKTEDRVKIIQFFNHLLDENLKGDK